MVVNSYSNIKESNLLLVIKSKNKKSLNNFLFFISNYLKTKKNLVKFFPIKNNIQKLTLLKSPHVNKTAQEQFESRQFSVKIFLKSKDTKLFSVMLKNLLNILFQDLKISIKIKVSNNLTTQIFNYFNYTLTKINKEKDLNETLKTKKIKIKQKYLPENMNKLIKLLKLFSLNGELLKIL